MKKSFTEIEIKHKLNKLIGFSSKEVRVRAANLYQYGHVHNVSINGPLIYSEVVSSSLDTSYSCTIDLNNLLSSDCECPYNWDLCKHIIATAMYVNKEVENKNQSFLFRADQTSTSFHFDSEESKHFFQSVPDDMNKKADALLKNGKFELLKYDDGQIEVAIKNRSQLFKVQLKVFKGEGDIWSSCKCKAKNLPFCQHKVAALKYLLREKGKYALDMSIDWTEYLLEEYALNDIDPDEVSKYQDLFNLEFQNRWALLTLKKGQLTPLGFFYTIPETSTVIVSPTDEKQNISDKYSLAYVLSFVADSDRPVCFFNVAKGKINKAGDKLKSHFELIDAPLEDDFFNEHADENDFQLIRFGGKLNNLMENDIESSFHTDSGDYSYPFFQRVIQLLNPILELLQDRITYVYEDEYGYNIDISLRACSLMPVSANKINVAAKLHSKGKSLDLEIAYHIGDKPISAKVSRKMFECFWIVKIKDTLYPWNNAASLFLNRLSYPNDFKSICFLDKHYDSILQKLVRFFQDKITIELPENMVEAQIDNNITEKKVYLKENDSNIYFIPEFSYDTININVLNQSKGNIYRQVDGKTISAQRDIEAEKDFRDILLGSHPDFKQQQYQDYFQLKAAQLLKDNWFIDFYTKCKENDIQLFGIKDLKSVRYYPARPNVNYSVKSDEDWFDLEMNVHFEHHDVSLSSLRKAIINKDRLIPIGDGLYGLLPEDFVQKFETSLKFGEIEGDKIKLPKTQFNVIYELLNEESDEKLIDELSEKMKLLKGFDAIEAISQPKKLKAQLRDYQLAGLSWLSFLSKFGFGGCLADDMGLGKTIQMISFFLHLKELSPRKKRTHLVVCPTTLLFNWENEISKFAPHLNTLVYWGINRKFDPNEWKKADVVLSTYGTMVNDIKELNTFEFTSVVFDESQALKNPSSLRFKASLLIKAKNRFSLTGTPIENNTIELFSQMQVLNRGLLGNLNFFRKTYGKNMSEDESKHLHAELRRIVYPFILRRTKAKVAKELPEKTEVELYCEMKTEQRNVYDAFRIKYREMLLNKIDEEGMNKARFNVLDGILKLRQICDSPALLNTEESYGDESIKTEELIRHIKEKTANHKVLVFSQFVRMLNIIRDRLEREKINYTSLDGKTRNRQEKVDYFQNTDDCRVFLISLKAGGFGLNLTAADYVFLIDPWWNPAVENQAIDRTHRIGQDKKVFAYRMICKDTIEEKILRLQKRKKNLAEEIITEESSFVKNLSKEDIEVLFS